MAFSDKTSADEVVAAEIAHTELKTPSDADIGVTRSGCERTSIAVKSPSARVGG